jgi:MFS family permease
VNRAAWVVVGVVFLDMLGFGMLIPGVQLRLEAMGAASWLIGLVQSSTFIVQSACSPMWGRFGDAWGRKPAFVACTFLSAASMGLYGAASGIGWVVASRLVAGFGAANVAAGQALVSGSETDRTANLGRIGAALTTGLIAGPALGGFVGAHWGNAVVGWIACGASLTGALAAALFLPNVKTPNAADKDGKRTSLLRLNPSLRSLVALSAIAWLSLACLEGTFGRLIHAQHGYGQSEFGLLFGFESLIAVIVQGVALNWLSHRYGDTALLVGGFVFQGLGLALTPLAPGLGALFFTSLLYAAGSSVANPSLQSRASLMVDDARQGELFGVLQSARSVGFMVGPTLGGLLFGVAPSLPYFVAGAVCVAAAALVKPLVTQPRT